MLLCLFKFYRLLTNSRDEGCCVTIRRGAPPRQYTLIFFNEPALAIPLDTDLHGPPITDLFQQQFLPLQSSDQPCATISKGRNEELLCRLLRDCNVDEAAALAPQ